MEWVKKHKKLIIVIAVVTIILAGAFYFLYSKYKLASQAALLLTNQSQELERLSRLNPHPGNEKVDNIKAAKEQEEQIRKLIENAKTTFQPILYPSNLTSAEFKLYLDRTLSSLRRYAVRNGVNIDNNFAFGFENIQNQLSFDPKDILPLSYQVAEIAIISRLLCDAKVLTVDLVRRPQVEGQTNQPTSSFDTSTSSRETGYRGPIIVGPPQPTQSAPSLSPAPGIYGFGIETNIWERRPITNQLAILMPYEFTFHCFTPELVRFLELVSKSPYGIIIKNIAVDTMPSRLLLSQPFLSPFERGGQVRPGPGPIDMSLIGRYGQPGELGAFGTFRTPRIIGGQMIFLEEQPIRVRAWIYVVRLNPDTRTGDILSSPGRSELTREPNILDITQPQQIN